LIEQNIRDKTAKFWQFHKLCIKPILNLRCQKPAIFVLKIRA